MSVSVQKQGLDLRGQELGKEASPRKAEIRQNRKSVGERPLDLADVGRMIYLHQVSGEFNESTDLIDSFHKQNSITGSGETIPAEEDEDEEEEEERATVQETEARGGKRTAAIPSAADEIRENSLASAAAGLGEDTRDIEDALLDENDNVDLRKASDRELHDRKISIDALNRESFRRKLLYCVISETGLSEALKTQIHKALTACLKKKEVTLEACKKSMEYHLNRELTVTEEEQLQAIYQEEEAANSAPKEEEKWTTHLKLFSIWRCSSCRRHTPPIFRRICFFCREEYCRNCLHTRQQASPKVHSRKFFCSPCFYAFIGFDQVEDEDAVVVGEARPYDYSTARRMARLCAYSYLRARDFMEEFDEYKCILQVASYNGSKALIAEGPDHIAIVFRGTNNLHNIIKDVQLGMTWFPSTLGRQKNVKIHIGFLKAYYAIRMSVLCAISNLYRDPSIAARKPLLITGHSLGGALAYLFAYDIRTTFFSQKDIVEVYTFGMPRTGNKAWAASFEKIISTCYRVANYRDPIPTLPGSIRFKHCGNLVLYRLSAKHLRECRDILTPYLEDAGEYWTEDFGTLMEEPMDLKAAVKNVMNLLNMAKHINYLGVKFPADIAALFSLGKREEIDLKNL